MTRDEKIEYAMETLETLLQRLVRYDRGEDGMYVRLAVEALLVDAEDD